MIDLIGFIQLGACIAKSLESKSPMRVYESNEQRFRRHQKEQTEREKERNLVYESYDYLHRSRGKRYDKDYEFSL